MTYVPLIDRISFRFPLERERFINSDSVLEPDSFFFSGIQMTQYSIYSRLSFSLINIISWSPCIFTFYKISENGIFVSYGSF